MLLLLFKLGARRYALDAMAVAQVLPVPTLEPAPPGPHGLAGLLRYRGGLVPVLDLRQIAEGEPCAPALSSRVILVGGRDGLLGLLAEHVTDTAHLDAAHQLAAIARQSSPDWLDPTLYEDEEGLAQRVHWAALLTPELRALAGPEPDPP
ncbi:chemotaxis-related protein WspB [Methylomagnum ishizawai]|uniref:Chemotaxis-related protein WspB n=1 Tax=Methylomagnum ishizawai TaxID=1760988 RepID=A0A1Y6D5T9_9GAMM|nr:chemotaxis protein CheW [Methylomagnum ishizawai]SMF95912.1 chemotaxis-related protein WspB [Methylomagnum ishizawai]